MLTTCNIEKPTPWLISELDGERNRLMYSALLHEVASRYSYEENPINFRTEFQHRKAPKGGFTISYHSVGDIRHVWRVKETPVPYFYSYDRLGFSAWSEISQFSEQFIKQINSLPLAKAKLFVEELKQHLLKNNISKYKQPNTTDTNLPENFIFFPLQVRSDIVFQFCYIDPLKVASYLAKRAKRVKQYLVIKRHPLCKSKKVTLFLNWLRLTNPYVVIANVSINQLLPQCSKVVVANSGVGFEALIHQKQVLSFAKSEYSIASQNFRDLPELEQLLKSNNIDKDFITKYIYFYLNYLCFDVRSTATIERFLDLAEFSFKNEIWCEKALHSIYKLIGKHE